MQVKPSSVSKLLPHPHEKRTVQLKKLLFPLLMLLVLLFGLLLRGKMFFSGDFYYLVDQARDLLLAKSLVVDQKLTLIGARTGIGGIFHGPLWIYLLAPVFALVKGHPFFTLAPVFLLVSMAIISSGFFIGLRLYGKWTGFVFALLLTIAAPLIQTVPFTTNAQVLPLVFLFYLFAVLQFMRGKERYFIGALLCIGLGFQFESAFAVLWIPVTVLAVIVRKKLPTRRSVVLGIGAFFCAVATFIFFDLRHQFLMTTSALRIFFNPMQPLPGYERYTDIGFRFTDRMLGLWHSFFTPLFTTEPLTMSLLLIILALSIFFSRAAKLTGAMGLR
jgi:hypothetical protein